MTVQYRRTDVRILCFWALVLLFVPSLAHAQVDREMLTLAQKAVTWVQGIAMSLSVIAVIRAGLSFLDDEKAPYAWGRMKVTLFGCAVIYGAVGIVQFIKAHFGTQSF